MSIVKPYTFVAGNKARANEVNEDFDVLYQQVNANITNIANVEGDVQNLSSTKANVNGDSTQRFAVADPVSSGDAVNKRTLFRQIGNSIDYIGGLTISKDSGSPNDTILIDPGAAYDSTKEVVLALGVLTTKQNSPQSANTAYYVYIIGSDSGSSVDILISTEPNVPALPTGYTRYRKIGSYTTDSNGYILDILTPTANIQADGMYHDVGIVYLSTTKTAGTYTLDLSSYLPNDTYCYEVYLQQRTFDSADTRKYVYMSSQIAHAHIVSQTDDYAYSIIDHIVLPVGSNKKITYQLGSNMKETCELIMFGYRRMGTNQ
jgi:hypothetical protein